MAVKPEFKCACCGGAFSNQKDSFYISKIDLFKSNSGRTTVCRECINFTFNEYTKKYEDKLYAFYHICAKFGWYFNEESFKLIENDKNIISAYLQKSNTGKNKGRTFDDNMREEHESSKLKETAAEDEGEDFDERRQKMIQRWGEGYGDNEYRFLEEEYNQWAAVYNCGEKNMQTLTEEICLTKLIIRRKRQLKESVKDDQKTLQDLMTSSNLKPMQETGANAGEQSTFGNFIKHIENERPIPEPSDEFRDADGILKYIRVWFFGHLSKIFGKQNEYSAEYEREIGQYTVEVPSFEDDL